MSSRRILGVVVVVVVRVRAVVARRRRTSRGMTFFFLVVRNMVGGVGQVVEVNSGVDMLQFWTVL